MKEEYEEYYSHILEKKVVQYEYHNDRDEVFSCTADTLEEARKKRDEWLLSRMY